MPIFTGTIFTWSPSTTNTTSIGFIASFFLSPLAELVPSASDDALALAVEFVFADTVVVRGGSALARVLVPFLLSFGTRVVTLANGTVSTLVRARVLIAAVTDMPGR